MFKNKYSFWFVILFLVIFTRLEIFIQPVGTDEGIFFHIAQEISKGHLLYHDVADHKQPLVFYWFAIIFKLFGHNVFIQRLVESLLCLGMVGFILKIGQRLFKSIKTSQIVSILFIVGINAHRIAQGGNHLEFYVAFFTLAALAVYFGKYGLSKKIRYLFLVGFLFGMGFLSKTVALFSFLGFCVGFMFIEKKFIKKLLILGTGFVLPLIFLCSIYYIQGNINNYIDVVYLKNISYTVSNLNWMRFITHFSEMIVDQILSLSFMWFALGVSAWFWIKRKLITNYQRLFYSMLCFELIACTLSFKFYGHYFIQLIPSLALITGLTLENKYITSIHKRYCYGLLVIVLLMQTT